MTERQRDRKEDQRTGGPKIRENERRGGKGGEKEIMRRRHSRMEEKFSLIKHRNIYFENIAKETKNTL